MTLLFDMNLISQLQELGLTLVGLVFLWAALAKLASKDDFKATMFSIPHFPPAVVPAVAFLLPPLEVAIGIGLILCIDVAKFLAIALLLMFCLLAVVVIKAKLKVPCNCFGGSEQNFSISTIVQNVGLILLILIGVPATFTGKVPLNLFISAMILLVALSVSMLWNNYKSVKELRRMNIVK